MKRIIWTAIVTALIIVAIPVLIVASGAINMAATSQPSDFEQTVATFAVQRSMAWRIPEKSAVPDSDDAVSHGLTHYASMCVRCHGGPGVEPEKFAFGLNPPAPALEKHLDDFSDEELFWIIKHGIRMTGMPSFGKDHSEEEIWSMVAFLRTLPNLTRAQKKQLKEAIGDSHANTREGSGGHVQSEANEKSGDKEDHSHSDQSHSARNIGE
ncbi:secreted protein [Rhodopirellula maiorica SM1]|uniref:Secreted protein n=1 Tax=Rhodopirellula maiorica SM1 TaxID=1265738 RepID=M5R840_9BACT|nr:cytochrome c [Rhodopirellula maiorica]EMI15555.1 secreted protein [Rhodopirellula maiorica SM1]